MSPSVSIVNIGTELTTGKIRDAHGIILSSLCTEFGLTVSRIVQVPDEPSIEEEILRCLHKDDLVLVTGGLGPTSDDITRDVVASITGCVLEFHEELWSDIQSKFRSRPPAASNKKQAEIPAGFSVIENPNGTAPGFYGVFGQSRIVVLPGPPGELQPMCDSFLRPYLSGEFCVSPTSQSIFTSFLIPESSLEEAATKAGDGVVGWRTRAEGDRIVFTLYGGSSEDRGMVAHALRKELGTLCFVDCETHASSQFIDSLVRSQKRVVLAESCTGGLIAKYLTDVPGSSRAFWGSFVTYDNEAKKELLEVQSLERCGAVSDEVAVEMAKGALRVSNADIAISVTGIAGPGGGSPEKPVGTVYLAIAQSVSNVRTFRCSFGGSRSRIRTRTAITAILLGWGVLEGLDIDSNPIWNYI